MKRKLGIFLVFLLLVFFQTVFSQGFYSERIKNFFVEITINKDGSFLVKENILYDFGGNLKHGIYRNVPLKNIKIKVLKVVDEFDNPYPFEVSKESGYLKIKIGDPKKLITGEHTYNIFYQVFNGLGFFKDHDELYWNITGNEWNVPIEKSEALIHLPEKVSKENLKFDCFTGSFGLKERECTFGANENGDINFQSNRSFSSGEGLTIVLGWPKGLIREPAIFTKVFWYLQQRFFSLLKFGPFIIPIFVFVYLFKEWWQKGKEPKIKKPIIVQYEPPDDLRPAEVNLIMNQKVQIKDITATVIDLAVRGYIKIREVKIKKYGIFKRNDYELIKLKNFEIAQELREYERELLREIFIPRSEKELLSGVLGEEKVSLSNLENKLYQSLPKIERKVYVGISPFKYFTSDPATTIGRWFSLGLIIFFIAIVFSLLVRISFLLGLSPQPFGSLIENFIFSLIISAALFLFFSFFMPQKTEKGAEVYWQILGFKEYINTAEKYRAQFYEKENIFEKYLPYAIAFGLVNKWAKAFEGIYRTPPSWYEGDFGPQFTTYAFVDSLNRSISSVNRVFGSSPIKGGSGLGGGGFSGGGGGGGGGGSW
jgi:uncharacterized membrane protein